jgi:mannose-6-phosphate isomerase-like protein (cupin superfamily)
MAKSYVEMVNKLAKENENFRQVLFTTDLSQLVLMSVEPNDDIGEETHDGIDQILTFVSGTGEAVLDGKKSRIKAGNVVVVPGGVKHNFINKGDEPLKLYTVYTPPEHKDGKIHRTKEDAENDPDEEH